MPRSKRPSGRHPPPQEAPRPSYSPSKHRRPSYPANRTASAEFLPGTALNPQASGTLPILVNNRHYLAGSSSPAVDQPSIAAQAPEISHPDPPSSSEQPLEAGTSIRAATIEVGRISILGPSPSSPTSQSAHLNNTQPTPLFQAQPSSNLGQDLIPPSAGPPSQAQPQINPTTHINPGQPIYAQPQKSAPISMGRVNGPRSNFLKPRKWARIAVTSGPRRPRRPTTQSLTQTNPFLGPNTAMQPQPPTKQQAGPTPTTLQPTQQPSTVQPATRPTASKPDLCSSPNQPSPCPAQPSFAQILARPAGSSPVQSAGVDPTPAQPVFEAKSYNFDTAKVLFLEICRAVREVRGRLDMPWMLGL